MKLLDILLYKETSDVVKRNVKVICQIAFLLIIMIAYNIYDGNYPAKFPDIPIVIIAFVIWWQIKRYNTYHPHLIFLFLLPLLAWAANHSITNFGIAGAFWTFPIVVLFYFCLPERLAWVASGVVLCVSLISAVFSYPPHIAMRLLISLTMVTICCAMIFRSLYHQNKRLAYQANRDELTGVYNRTLLASSLKRAIATTGYAEHPPAILCIDADHFKRINDTYGHQMGDQVLIKIAHALKAELTHLDDRLFRLGGEEFLMLLHARSAEQVKTIANSLLANVAKLDVLPNSQQVTISIGASIYEPPATWTQWMRETDNAMYSAKENGRNCLVTTFS